MRRHLPALLLLAALACSKKPAPPPAPDAGPADAGDLDTPPEPAVYTPRWAFQPWISKDISTAADTRDFVKGFEDRDIPVGVVVLDSPWETNYNTFIPNPNRYPGFEGLLGELHGKGIRMVLWTTQMVNKSSFDFEPGGDQYPNASPNFYEGLRNKFYVNDGNIYLWWKGQGCGVDFFNRDARAWWHRQQDLLLDMGVDGWKLDFGEQYIDEVPFRTAAGPVDRQTYSEAYYRDFLAYGREKRGKEFLTMVRPWDASYNFPGRFYARKEHAPVAWVGDNRRDWIGLADALDEMFRSAAAGYPVLGSDIGGYLDKDDVDLTGPTIPFDTLVFARWTAVGALGPFMQLHGRANITPWTVPDNVDATVALYRAWAKLHAALAPFHFSLAREAALAGGGPVMRPLGAEAEWAGDYRYTLGDALLVAPLLDATSARAVPLPAGSRWYDWWDPAAAPLDGGQTVPAGAALPRDRVPLYVREGALLPLDVVDDANGLGTAASRGALTLLAWPGPTQTSFKLYEDDDSVTDITAKAESPGATVTLSRLLKPLLLRVRSEAAPAAVERDGAALAQVADRAALDAAASGWFYEAATRSAWVKLPAGGAASVRLR